MSQQSAPTFLNTFPAQVVPTPQSIDPSPGSIQHGVIDPGNIPGPVTPPPGLTGPIDMRPGWHTAGPSVALVNPTVPMTYSGPEMEPGMDAGVEVYDEGHSFGMKLAGYAILAAIGYAAGQKFAPKMPVKILRSSVPTAGALTGMGVAAAAFGDYDGGLMRGAGLLGASVAGVYVAKMVYPGK
jgi:hypothetical protein